jgi:hypothetical protein
MWEHMPSGPAIPRADYLAIQPTNAMSGPQVDSGRVDVSVKSWTPWFASMTSGHHRPAGLASGEAKQILGVSLRTFEGHWTCARARPLIESGASVEA